jgi:hypothetical protein
VGPTTPEGRERLRHGRFGAERLAFRKCCYSPLGEFISGRRAQSSRSRLTAPYPVLRTDELDERANGCGRLWPLKRTSCAFMGS